MNRLQKKCFLASTGLHLLLVLTLLCGSAFLRPTSTPSIPDPSPGAGAPTIHLLPPPALSEPAPAPSAPPPVLSEPRPVPTVVSPSAPVEPEPEPQVVEEREVVRPRLPRVNLTLVTRTRNPSNPGNGSSTRSNRPPVRNERVERMGQAVEGLFNGLSSGTAVNLNFGAGQGGGSRRAYDDIVRETYNRSWDPVPAGVTSEEATARVVITISSSGKVVSARIAQVSGDGVLDASVQRALERVTSLEPFEPGATDKQRTYTINFNLKAKRSGF